MPEISVIIPIYNAARYLSECLTSIVGQTFQDFEIICINDGSTDHSLEIIKEFQEKDSRIILVDQKNQGVSVARNAGLEIASGKYIGFIDADDTVENTYFEELHFTIEDSNLKQLSGCGFSGSQIMSVKKNTKLICDFTEIEIIDILDSYLLFMPFCKLFNRTVIDKNKVKFCKNIHFAEDLLFNFEYLKHINEFSISDKVLYNYNFQNSNSLSKAESFFKFESNEKMNSVVGEFLKQVNSKSTVFSNYNTIKSYWNAYNTFYYLFNNLNEFGKAKTYRHIEKVIQFNYFAGRKNFRGEKNILLKIAEFRNIAMIYYYMKFRSFF